MDDKILYIIATPIGNLEDVTYRAIDRLKSVEVIICEDTRHTRRLLDRYGVENKLISIHQHSSEEKIKDVLVSHGSMAYVSDAGTPGIADPGGKVVSAAVALGIRVEPIPGPSAVIAALSISGVATDKFMFLGFLPHKGKGKYFQMIKDRSMTVVFYESPHRIVKTLEAMGEYVGSSQPVIVARELTKKFETVYRGSLDVVIESIKDKPKGEFVVIVPA